MVTALTFPSHFMSCLSRSLSQRPPVNKHQPPAQNQNKRQKPSATVPTSHTVNALIQYDGYKLPNIQDMFAKITQKGSQPRVYSVIDLAGAFNQLYLDKESADLLVLNTCKGLMGTKRLCFGIKTAPAQFQATMDKILVGIEGVLCYVDDILVVTNSVEEHMRVLKLVFQ